MAMHVYVALTERARNFIATERALRKAEAISAALAWRNPFSLPSRTEAQP